MCIYNGPLNTVGIGNPVPFGSAANMGFGSGDRFDFGPGWGNKKNYNKSKKAYQQYKPYMKQPAPSFPGVGKPLPLLVMSSNHKSVKRKPRKRK